jgi:hypothetical protein
VSRRASDDNRIALGQELPRRLLFSASALLPKADAHQPTGAAAKGISRHPEHRIQCPLSEVTGTQEWDRSRQLPEADIWFFAKG